MNRHSRRLLASGVVLALAALLLAACTAIQISDEQAEELWAKSDHAEAKGADYKAWNKLKPPAMPVECAQCHSTPGFLDYHGADGSAAGVVDQTAPTNTAVECAACHTEAVEALTTATLPSGHTLQRLGDNTSCAGCHSGNAAGADVAQATDGREPDVIDPALAFINIHANAAVPILFGSEAGAGYHYEGRLYSSRYTHVAGFRDCVECHDAHSLRLAPAQCSACHAGVRQSTHLRNVRMTSLDFDGDGDTQEGMALEIEAMQERLLAAIETYVQGIPDAGELRYRDEYPYFVDAGGDPFAQWTPRLLRAAYNYHLVAKGKGAFTHNPAYTLQLLYDSIEDLNGDLRGAVRPPAN